MTTLADIKTFYHSIDARYFQMFALGSLTTLQIRNSDFGTSLEILTLTLYSISFFHIMLSLFLKKQHFDVRSSLISAFSISLLLRSNELWIYPLAALLAVLSKAFVKDGDKHIFNPAAFSIVSLLLFMPETVWVSVGQWGSASWFAALLICLGSLVLTRARTIDLPLFFLSFWTSLTFARAVWLGDPISIPMHQLQSGALLIFTFFMISDPVTAPRHLHGRVVFALAVACLAFLLHFEFRIREGLFYALIIGSLWSPIFNRLWVAPSYNWITKENKS